MSHLDSGQDATDQRLFQVTARYLDFWEFGQV
jgi:hypothetical protein